MISNAFDNVCWCWLVLAMNCCALAANSDPLANDERPLTLEENLKRENVSPSQSSLLNALEHGRPEVRSLVALKLGADRNKDSIPYLLKALKSGQNLPANRLTLAYALAQFGVTEGIEALRQVCWGSEWSWNIKLSATNYLLELGDESCLETVITAPHEAADLEPLVQALELLPRFRHVPPSVQPKLLAFILTALESSSAGVRMSASDVLVRTGHHDISAIRSLKDAIARERDRGVRWKMQSDLLGLERARE